VAELSTAHFKEVLGHFATGVVVVAATTDAGPVGFTCQSFAALSLEPLLVTFAAKTDGNSWPRIREVGSVGISVLAENQETIARTMATSSSSKFDDVPHFLLPSGSPGVAGALAHIEGDIASVTSCGDHDIVVVSITGLASSSGRPLLYFRGGFGTFQT
jgi:flavin reductase (DIM6/NTAB) family NADH-FMN oxidoreductase RutF